MHRALFLQCSTLEFAHQAGSTRVAVFLLPASLWDIISSHPVWAAHRRRKPRSARCSMGAAVPMRLPERELRRVLPSSCLAVSDLDLSDLCSRGANGGQGLLVAAGIMLCAQPYIGQAHGAASVYEGDHQSGVMRLPSDVSPREVVVGSSCSLTAPFCPFCRACMIMLADGAPVQQLQQHLHYGFQPFSVVRERLQAIEHRHPIAC